MTAVYIILGIALLFFLLSLLRVGVRVRLGEVTELTVLAGPARIRLLPKGDKPPRHKKEKPKKAAPSGEPKKKGEKKLSLTAQDIRELLPAVWESVKGGLRRTRQRLLIDPLRLSATLGGAPDPAGAVELYGYINAAMWTVMPQLERLARIPDPRLHVEVDFDADRLKLTGEVGLSFRIGDLVAIGWAFVKPLAKWFLAAKKRKKPEEKAPEKAPEERQKQQVQQASAQDAAHTTK